jgi:hypothetical protein
MIDIGITTICLAWVVRTALLVLYVPVRILSNIVESVHRLDLWASAVILQYAGQVQANKLELGPQQILRVAASRPPQSDNGYSTSPAVRARA